jgi:hypothetical protein
MIRTEVELNDVALSGKTASMRAEAFGFGQTQGHFPLSAATTFAARTTSRVLRLTELPVIPNAGSASGAKWRVIKVHSHTTIRL